MATRKKHLLKIILLGDSGVGKTSLMVRFVQQKFSNAYKATIGADFLSKELEVEDKLVTLQIWDTAGQERFHGLGNAFFRGSDACVFVFFYVTNEKSFERLSEWKDAFVIQSALGNPETFPFMVIGNKIDKEKERVVTKKRAEQWCKNQNIPYYEASAKEAINVEQAFNDLTKTVLQKFEHEEPIVDVPSEIIDINKTEKKDSKGCC